MANRNDFDYLGYATASGVELQEGDVENENIRSALYSDAVTTSISAFKKEKLLSQKQAILETENLLEDTRQVLGLSQRRTDEEQRSSLFAPAYKKYIRENKLHELNPEADLDFFVNGYIKKLSDDDWANPNIAGRPATENQNVLKAQLENIEQDTLKDWMETKYELQEVPLTQVNGPVDRTKKENQGLLGRMSDAFTRSIYTNDVQNAVDGMFNIEDSYMVDADTGGLVLEEVTLEGTRPVVNDVQVVKKTPEEVQQEQDAAIKQFIIAVNEREKTPLDSGLQTILESEDVSTAFSNLVKDPSAMAVILAEQGIDVLQEGVVQLGATALGSLATTPAGGVAIGSGAMSAVVRDNVYNSFLSQEIENYLAESKLELNEDNIKQFISDEEKLNEAKEKANISSNIIMGGAFASGLVGGGVGLSSVAKLAARLGLRPAVKGSEVVFEQVAKRSVGSLVGAGAASTVIDVVADSASKLAIGEDISPGELVLTLGTGVAGAGADVAAGGVSRIGSTADQPLQIRTGDVLLDGDGNELIVKSGSGGKLQVVGNVTESVEEFGETSSIQEFEINGVDIGSTYQVKSDTEVTPQGFDDDPSQFNESVSRQTISVRERTPTTDSDYDINESTGLEFEVTDDGTDADLGANWFNYHIKRVAASTGLDAPPEYVSVGEETDSQSPLFAGFKGETDLFDTLTNVGKALRKLVNEETDTKGANRTLIGEIQKQGLIEEDGEGRYQPAYDDSVVASADEIQLKSWFAAIANSASSDLPLPQKIKPSLTPLASAVRQTVPDNDVDLKPITDFLNEANSQETADTVLQELKTLRQEVVETNRDGLGVSEQAALDFRLRQLDEDITEVESYLGEDQPQGSVTVTDDEIIINISGDFNGDERAERLINSFVEKDGVVGFVERDRTKTYFVKPDGEREVLFDNLDLKTIDDIGVVPVEVEFDDTVNFSLENNRFTIGESEYEFVSEGSDINGEPTVVAKLGNEEVVIDDESFVYEILAQKIQSEIDLNTDYESQLKEINRANQENGQSNDQDTITNDGTEVQAGESGRTEETNTGTTETITEKTTVNSNSILRKKDGTPFKSEKSAKSAMKRAGFTGRVIEEKGGFVGIGQVLTNATEVAQQPTPPIAPTPPPPGTGLAINKVIPVIKQPVEVDFADIPGNFIPADKISAIQDAGYVVEIHQDRNDNIFALTLTDNEVPNRSLVVMTNGKSNRAASNKDRTVKVYLGGSVQGRKVVKGKELKSAGGNKHFTIPPETIIIEAGDNFIDSLEQAAFNNGMEVRKESGQGIAERSVYGKAPGPRGRVAVISHDGDRVYVDGKVQDASIGLRKEAGTVADKVKETLTKLNTELLAEVNFTRTTKPQRVGINEKRTQQLENIGEVMDTDYTVVDVTDDGQSYVQTGSVPLLLDTRAGMGVQEVLNQVVMDTTHHDSLIFDGDRSSGNREFKTADIQKYVDTLPPHIRDIIVLHNEPNNPASTMGALGFFAPDYQGNGPAIHIDVRPTIQSFEGVISTLSEEVAHFSFNSWTTGFGITPMEGFYNKAFELYKDEIAASLQAYINHPERPIDVNDASPVDKFILVNELFSKQGTSIVDFVDNKTVPPAGLSRSEIDSLRSEGRDDIDSFTFNMSDIENISPEGKQGVKEFAKAILRAQASGVTGKRVVFDYEVGSNRFRIVPTVVGQSRSTIPNTKRAKKAARARSVSGRKDTLGSLRKMYEQNKLSENGISLREVQRIITANTAIAESRANKRFRSDLILAKKANAIMNRKGVERITDETYADGYTAAFKNAGATSKRELRVAAEADEYLSTAFSIAVEQHQLIKQEVREHVTIIENLSRENADGTPALMSPFAASKAINEIQRNAQRYKVNWDHIRYNAYENPKDQDFFNEAVQQFDPESDYKGKTFAQQKDEAEIEMRRIESSSMRDKDAAIAVQEQIINKYERIKHLEQHFRLKDQGRSDGSKQYQKEISNFLRSLQEDSRQYQGSGFGKLSQISANKVRKLDQQAGENTSDWHLIQFLDPITDPLEVAVYNVHQRHEVLSKLKANRRLAETLLHHGQAYPVGSEGSTTASGRVSILEGQQGSVLDYIQVDAVVAEDIRDQIDIQRTIDGGIISRAVGLAKQMATVFNLPLALTNYLGVPYMMTLNGDIFYFSKWVTPNGGIRAAWKQRVESEGGESNYTQQLINEAVENDLFGLGTQAGTLEVINQNDILEKGFTKATGMLNKMSLLAEDRKIGVDEKFTKVIDFLQDFYTFSDDMPKVISYMVNKERALTKWEAKLNKQDYQSVKQWKKAVNDNAVREAIDRTKRINTDWGVMPRGLKSVVYSNKRWIFTDFLTHNAQMSKIVTENFNLYSEDYTDLKEARSIGAKDWERSIRNTMFARVAGNGAILAGLGYGTVTGLSLMGAGVNNLLEFVNEELMGMDYDEDENLLDSVQREGLTELMKYVSYDGAIMYEPLPYRDNDGNVYFVNWNRLNPAGALYAPPAPSEEVEFLDQSTAFMKNLFLAGDNGTLVNQMYDAVRGIDWKGDRVKSNAEYAINALSTIGNLYTPGTVKKSYELLNGRNWYGTQVVPKEVGAANMLGAGMKYFKPEDVMRKIGKQMQGDIVNSGISKTLIDSISSGNGSTSRTMITTMLNFEKSQTDKLMRRYNNALNAGSNYGWSGKEMRKLLSEDRSALSQERAKKFLRGKNVFIEQTGTKLKNKLKAIREKKVNSVTFPKEWKDRAVGDIEFAIEQYDLLLKQRN